MSIAKLALKEKHMTNSSYDIQLIINDEGKDFKWNFTRWHCRALIVGNAHTGEACSFSVSMAWWLRILLLFVMAENNESWPRDKYWQLFYEKFYWRLQARRLLAASSPHALMTRDSRSRDRRNYGLDHQASTREAIRPNMMAFRGRWPWATDK